RLSGLLYVALEENDTAGAQRRQHQAQARREGRPIATHDEQLANPLAKFEAGFCWHGNRRVYRERGGNSGALGHPCCRTIALPAGPVAARATQQESPTA